MYGTSHWSALFIIGIAAYMTIRYALKSNSEKEKRKIGIFISFIPIIFLLSRDALILINGTFDPKIDLPLHLCRFSALLLPIMHITLNRFLFGILYFWTVVGAGNAIATPDLLIDFPSWEYFVYFIGHCFLVIGSIYAVLVYKMYPGWKDLKNAIIGTNLYVILSMVINYAIGSNYFYTLGKPEVPTLLDFLGPWPIYLITGQLLMFALFILALLPFQRQIKLEKKIG